MEEKTIFLWCFSWTWRWCDDIRNFVRLLLNSELLKVILSSGETSKKDSFLFHKQFWILHKLSIYHQNICSYLRNQGYVSSATQVEFEDEMNFLMFCSKYDKTRQDLFSIVGMTCINFQNLSIEEIFLWLMTCENDLVIFFRFLLSSEFT
jgi:hypothetical protein